MRKTIDNVYKGLSTSTLDDTGYFSTLDNLTWDKNKNLITRDGITQFHTPIPSTAITIDLCDATTGWTNSGDAGAISTTTAIRGSNALTYTITPSGGTATVTKATSSQNIMGNKGYVGFFTTLQSGFSTGLTTFMLRLGSDSSNYYEWDLNSASGTTFQYLPFSDATMIGSPTDTAIDYIAIIATYGSYSTYAVIFDDIRVYSSLSTNPVTSLFFHQFDDTLEEITLACSGTSVWKKETDGWSSFDTITEFEGVKRTRMSFAVYKNVVYYCNGVDDYRSWNRVAVTTYPSQPKIRFIQYMGDRLFGAGDDSNPSTLYYTAALPVDGSAINTSVVVVGGDEQGKIEGIKEIGQNVLVGKTKKWYSVNVVDETTTTIDAGNGLASHRSIQNVGASLMFYRQNEVDSLKNRVGVQGASALEPQPLSTEVRQLLNGIEYTNSQAVCSAYDLGNTIYYLGYPESGNICDTILLYHATYGGWARWDIGSFYDIIYTQGASEQRILIGSGTSGVVYTISGNNDDGLLIPHNISTCQYDYGTTGEYYMVDHVTFNGFMRQGTEINLTVNDGDISVGTGVVDDSKINTTSSVSVIGTAPIGVHSIGGNNEGETLYEWFIRIPIYAAVGKLSFSLSSTGGKWTLKKISSEIKSLGGDFIATNFFA